MKTVKVDKEKFKSEVTDYVKVLFRKSIQEAKQREIFQPAADFPGGRLCGERCHYGRVDRHAEGV